MNFKNTLLRQIIREEISKQLRLNEALNKDMRAFARDIENSLKSKGFNVSFIEVPSNTGGALTKIADVIKQPTGVAIALERRDWAADPESGEEATFLDYLSIYSSIANHKAIGNILKKYQVTILGNDAVTPSVFLKSGKKYSPVMNLGDIYTYAKPESRNLTIGGIVGWHYYKKLQK